MLPSFFSRSMSINNRKKWIANSCDAWHRAHNYCPLPRMGECTASHLHEPLGKLNSLLLHELRVPIPLVEPESALLWFAGTGVRCYPAATLLQRPTATHFFVFQAG